MTAEGAAAVFSLLADPGKPRTFPLPDATATAVRDAFAWWPLRKEALGREMIRSRVSAIVLGAAAALDKGPADASANRVTGSRIRVVLKWLEEHPETMPTNRELADLAGLSSASFHSHFKRITGCSPKDYHLRRLVERAAVRLTGDPGLSVTRLAHDLGFSSSQYFATVFRRYHGLAPSDYRRASRERGLSR
jgi:AraC-like DNA-binding protein